MQLVSVLMATNIDNNIATYNVEETEYMFHPLWLNEDVEQVHTLIYFFLCVASMWSHIPLRKMERLGMRLASINLKGMGGGLSCSQIPPNFLFVVILSILMDFFIACVEDKNGKQQ